MQIPYRPTNFYLIIMKLYYRDKYYNIPQKKIP
jgi:hypothetical protein